MKKLINRIQQVFGCLFPRARVRVVFLRKFGHLPDMKDPSDINEKIQWLKFHCDQKMWADLADKYKVREFVASKGLEKLLVPLYGKYDSVEGLHAAWDSLQAPFVIKTNNACKEVIIVKDKASDDVGKICAQLRKWLGDKTFWGFYVEPHYRFIKPCIIVEKYLEEKGEAAGLSSSLIDYKIWCLGGRPRFVFVSFDRKPESLCIDCYDTDWNRLDGKCVYAGHYRQGPLLPRPDSLKEMLEYASTLSEGLPQVRVDFYDIAGQVSFGEMTLTSAGGFMNYFTPDFLQEMGRMCKI